MSGHYSFLSSVLWRVKDKISGFIFLPMAFHYNWYDLLEAVFSPNQIFDILIKSQLDVHVCVYFWVFSSFLLSIMPLFFMAVPCNFYYYITVAKLKITYGNALSSVKLLCIIWLSWIFLYPNNFKLIVLRTWNFRIFCQNEICIPYPILPRLKHYHIRGDQMRDWKS